MTLWLAAAGAGGALLLLTWVIYPVIMIRRGRARAGGGGTRKPPPDRQVSVVVATREAPAAVQARIDDLLAGTWPAGHLELVVAVDGDPAPYRSLAASHPSVKLQVVSGGLGSGKAAALNAGVAATRGEVLVFADTAQRFAPEAISHLVSALEDGRYAAVSGALQIGNEDQGGGGRLLASYWKVERRLREAEALVHSAIGVSGSIYAMQHSEWVPLPEGLILDDLWTPMQLILRGRRVGFESRAVALDTRVTTSGQEYRRKVRTLTGNLQLVAWMPEVLLPWRNPVWIQFWCHKLLRLATPWALLVLLIGSLGAAFTASPSLGAGVVAAGSASVLLVALLPGKIGRAVRGSLQWGATMHAAIVSATWKGLRGRWDVWAR